MSDLGSHGEARDDEVGAALRQLPVPPPRDDFYSTLLSRLEQEAGPSRQHDRASPRWWRPQSPLWFGAAAAVLVVVLIATWVGLPGGDRLLGPGPAAAITAEEVRRRVDDALASLRTLQGDITDDQHVSDPDAPIRGRTERHSFLLTSSGDFRVNALDTRRVTAYSAARGSQRTFGGTGAALSTEVTGLAPGPPDPAPTATILSRSLGALVRSFLRTDADVPVTENEFEGRPGWHLVVPLTALGQLVGELDVTVDRQTGIPVHILRSDIGSTGERVLVSEVRVSNLRVDEPVDPAVFSPEFPVGTRTPTTSDRGYRRVQQREVAATVGYQPILPDTVPRGFKLTEMTVARDGANTAPGNPPSRNVVSTAWQRGFDRFVVSTRETGPDRARWIDPFRTGSLLAGSVEPLTIDAGAVQGGRGEVVVVPNDVPHAWIVTDRLVVTVSGDLTPEEMRDVLRSLRAT